MNAKGILTAALTLVFAVGAAQADLITDDGTVSFDSALNPNGIITLDMFDTTLGTLNSATVEIWHSGEVSIQGDNDDSSKSGTANATMVRTFTVVGPDINTGGTKTVDSAPVFLAADNGDKDSFDPNAPDGHDFGMLSYVNEYLGSYAPNMALYQTAGPGTVDLTVDPTAMLNDLAWISAPADYQVNVQGTDLTVFIKVTYDYTPVPEPTTLGLLSLGLLVLRRRRRA